MQSFLREPEYVTLLPDGTVKQINPLTGAQVWTVPGRGNRPLEASSPAPPRALSGERGCDCAFCACRYLDTPPEKSRVVRDGWRRLYRLPAEELFDTVAEFRCIPNLFEILSYDYWHANYGYELPEQVATRRDGYLASATGRAHVLNVIESKLRASGMPADEVAALDEGEKISRASGFFGGGHDLIIARRHFIEGATDETQLASSGTLTPEEHGQFIAYTVESVKRAYELNRYARYVAVFQNWLRPAGASFDHLHKQLVSIDAQPARYAAARARVQANPNFFNEVAPNYAAQRNLIIADNGYALALAGFGHRYPTIEIYSTSQHCDPWTHSPEELRGMSDMIHAMHAATGPAVPCNEEWHYRPIDMDTVMPWHVMLKWRVSTLAGFEGATKIYLNTIAPAMLRERVVGALELLRDEHRITPDLSLGEEVEIRSNFLRYHRC